MPNSKILKELSKDGLTLRSTGRKGEFMIVPLPSRTSTKRSTPKSSKSASSRSAKRIVPPNLFSTSTELSPLDYTSIAFDLSPKNKDVKLVLYYAHWCPHCVSFVDEFNALIKLVGEGVCKTYNCANNNAHLQKMQARLPGFIQGFPTIILYKDGKPVEEYKGKRSKEELAKYIRSH